MRNRISETIACLALIIALVALLQPLTAQLWPKNTDNANIDDLQDDYSRSIREILGKVKSGEISPEEASPQIQKIVRERANRDNLSEAYLEQINNIVSRVETGELSKQDASLLVKEVINTAFRHEFPPSEWHSPPELVLMEGSGVETADFIIFKGDLDNFYAKSGENGGIRFSGSDASTVIQSAINALGGGGGRIFIKTGRYRISSTISVSSSVTLEGEGRGTLLNGKASANPVIELVDGVKFAQVKNLQVRGTTGGEYIGIWMGEGSASYVTISNVTIDFCDIGLYIEQVRGNTCEVRNVRIFNCSSNWVQINGANQLYFYNLHIAMPGNNEGKHGIVFSPLDEREVMQAQNIKFFGGHFWMPDKALRWADGVTGLRISFFGTEFEGFNQMISVEANQNGNLYVDFYGITVFGNGTPERIIHGENLSEQSGRFTFHDSTFVGGVDDSFEFKDQPDYYLSFQMEGQCKFTSGFPRIWTSNSGTATIENGNTSVTVSHGLSGRTDAEDIQVTPLNDLGAASTFWVSNISSDNFVIKVDHSPKKDINFAWRVKHSESHKY